MLKCWDGNLYSRPPFSKVVELITSILESRERLAFSPTSVLDFLASDDGNSESSSENGDLGPEIITNPYPVHTVWGGGGYLNGQWKITDCYAAVHFHEHTSSSSLSVVMSSLISRASKPLHLQVDCLHAVSDQELEV